MAARATRSASRKARLTEAVATGPLGALSHDELGVIVDGLADPLQPVVAVALSSTCLGLRTPLQAALEVLKERHARAAALYRKVGCWDPVTRNDVTFAELGNSERLYLYDKRLVASDLTTVGMILRTCWLPKLKAIDLCHNFFGNSGMQTLCESLDRGAVPSLRSLTLTLNSIGPVGAEAFAAALRRGALPNLENLILQMNYTLGNQGAAALAAPLRKLTALKWLELSTCAIGDEGVASLVADLGKDDFKSLKKLHLARNPISDAGPLVAALDRGALPCLEEVVVSAGQSAADAAVAAALARARARRAAA